MALGLTPPISRFSIGEADTAVARSAARTANFILDRRIGDQGIRYRIIAVIVSWIFVELIENDDDEYLRCRVRHMSIYTLLSAWK